MTADDWIRGLDLQPHPEGGYFRETYRAGEAIAPDALPPRFESARSFGTAIYFLLKSGEYSAFHRIASDEIWHVYDGAWGWLHLIHPNGDLQGVGLGLDPASNRWPQAVVPAGCWFAAEVPIPDSFLLVGCTVAPGFDFADFELAKRTDLVARYPQHRELIERLTKE